MRRSSCWIHVMFHVTEGCVLYDPSHMVLAYGANAIHYKTNLEPPFYGTVNTVLLTREPDYTVFSPHMTSGSSLDVDNKAFQRVVGKLLNYILLNLWLCS